MLRAEALAQFRQALQGFHALSEGFSPQQSVVGEIARCVRNDRQMWRCLKQRRYLNAPSGRSPYYCRGTPAKADNQPQAHQEQSHNRWLLSIQNRIRPAHRKMASAAGKMSLDMSAPPAHPRTAYDTADIYIEFYRTTRAPTDGVACCACGASLSCTARVLTDGVKSVGQAPDTRRASLIALRRCDLRAFRLRTLSPRHPACTRLRIPLSEYQNPTNQSKFLLARKDILLYSNLVVKRSLEPVVPQRDAQRGAGSSARLLAAFLFEFQPDSRLWRAHTEAGVHGNPTT